MKTYDHIILGTGQATGVLLGRLISTGDSIAVIEEAKVAYLAPLSNLSIPRDSEKK